MGATNARCEFKSGVAMSNVRISNRESADTFCNIYRLLRAGQCAACASQQRLCTRSHCQGRRTQGRGYVSASFGITLNLNVLDVHISEKVGWATYSLELL